MRQNSKLRRKKGFILGYDKKTALSAAIIVSFLLAALMLSSSIYYSKLLDETENIAGLIDIISWQSILTLLANTLIFYLLLRFQFWVVSRFYDKSMIMWLIMIGLTISVIFLSPYISQFQWWWFRDKMSPTAYSTILYIKDLVILIVSLLFTFLIYVIIQNQKNISANQALVIENLQNRYNALKNQTDPHFLFNSLNTLTGLIGYNQDNKARKYVSQLSNVFRYVMRDTAVVKLSDELDFAESYMYLMKIRYNDGLKIEYNINEKCESYYVIPSGLQILIENAIKHNIVSQRNPLTIEVSTINDNVVRVENNLQKKVTAINDNGLGLHNLNELYYLMFNKNITVYSDESKFIVEIPLIKNIHEYENTLNKIL